MEAVKKTQSTTQDNPHSPHLESLLLDKGYKQDHTSTHKHESKQTLNSRIEAEYQLENFFR